MARGIGLLLWLAPLKLPGQRKTKRHAAEGTAWITSSWGRAAKKPGQPSNRVKERVRQHETDLATVRAVAVAERDRELAVGSHAGSALAEAVARTSVSGWPDFWNSVRRRT